jgi:hypothetical protein
VLIAVSPKLNACKRRHDLQVFMSVFGLNFLLIMVQIYLLVTTIFQLT